MVVVATLLVTQHTVQIFLLGKVKIKEIDVIKSMSKNTEKETKVDKNISEDKDTSLNLGRIIDSVDLSHI